MRFVDYEHSAILCRPRQLVIVKPLVIGPYRRSAMMQNVAICDPDKVVGASSPTVCSQYLKGIEQQCEMDEGEEDDIAFVVAAGNSAEALEPAEEAFHLAAAAVEFRVVVPRVETAGLGRHDG